MNNTSPKGKVANLAGLVYPGSNVEVHGTRVKGHFGGYFLAEINVNDHTVARSRHQNWRKAYKGLEIELSKLGVV
jgi:hypothetical protein